MQASPARDPVVDSVASCLFPAIPRMESVRRTRRCGPAMPVARPCASPPRGETGRGLPDQRGPPPCAGLPGHRLAGAAGSYFNTSMIIEHQAADRLSALEHPARLRVLRTLMAAGTGRDLGPGLVQVGSEQTSGAGWQDPARARHLVRRPGRIGGTGGRGKRDDSRRNDGTEGESVPHRGGAARRSARQQPPGLLPRQGRLRGLRALVAGGGLAVGRGAACLGIHEQLRPPAGNA